MKSTNTNETFHELNKLDERVISSAWDAVIYRDQIRPLYHFSPPQDGDAEVAARLGVDFSPVCKNFVLIHLPPELDL